MDREQPTAFRLGGVSYLRIPAPDPPRLAAFYERVFGWRFHGDPDEPGFEDATGHVVGHLVRELDPAGEAGIRPYVYVADVDATLALVAAEGGEVAEQPYAEGDLWVATLRDPAGNVVGVWHRGPRGAAAAP